MKFSQEKLKELLSVITINRISLSILWHSVHIYSIPFSNIYLFADFMHFAIFQGVDLYFCRYLPYQLFFCSVFSELHFYFVFTLFQTSYYVYKFLYVVWLNCSLNTFEGNKLYFNLFRFKYYYYVRTAIFHDCYALKCKL